MPPYPWLYGRTLDTSHVGGKVITLRRLGVPYPDGYETQALPDLQAQAASIAGALRQGGFDVRDDEEIVALIAYLQRLGTDIRTPAVASAGPGLPEGGR
jgi:cytochrome c oxidase cbb3-type subunit I/II